MEGAMSAKLVAKSAVPNNASKTDQRARKSAQAVKYAPRVVAPQKAASASVEDIRLRRLTAQVLDELKRPDAIPSRIVMAALEQAKALGATK
jgi:hypothetical protein